MKPLVSSTPSEIIKIISIAKVYNLQLICQFGKIAS